MKTKSASRRADGCTNGVGGSLPRVTRELRPLEEELGVLLVEEVVDVVVEEGELRHHLSTR